ncbi:MAG: HD domain-containing protein, partial [Desulfamplus sp.]|nr:HD domain-containing protein [Desulfamplus sp.]
KFAGEKELLHNSLKQINKMSQEREELRNELVRTVTDLKNHVSGTLDFLLAMVESRDDRQRGHSRRVAEISLFVAEKMGLGEASRVDLQKAALLHDVGILLIPDNIMEKDRDNLYRKDWDNPSCKDWGNPSRKDWDNPSRKDWDNPSRKDWDNPSQKDQDNRSRYERDMLDLRFVRGADYLAKCPGFERTAEIIRHLNENSDGTGFPDRLKKRHIPLVSRILTGADILDQLWMGLWDGTNFDSSPEPLSEAHAGESLSSPGYPSKAHAGESLSSPGYPSKAHAGESLSSPGYPSKAHAGESFLKDILAGLEELAGTRLDPSVVNYLEQYVASVAGHARVTMREVALSRLEPGMVMGTSLFTRTGTKLLTPGTRLTSEIIAMMIRYNREYPVDDTVYIRVE